MHRKLKELRIKNGLNQKELADEMGYKQNTVSQWENGQRAIDTNVLGKLADFYGVSADYLLGRSPKVREIDDPLQNRLIAAFSSLNDLGKKEAIKRVAELSELEKYRIDYNENSDCMPIAAHNDAEINKKELKLMQEDIDEL